MNFKSLFLLAMSLGASAASASITAGKQAAAGKIDLNDVSYLFPLPTGGNLNQYVKASESIPILWMTQDLAETNGLPFSVDLRRRDAVPAEQYRALALDTFKRTVLLSFRVDPCFKDLFSDSCRPQIRAVWQPLDQNRNAVDATIHTFYDFTPGEFNEILTELMQLKAKFKVTTKGLPLQVHPGFTQNGFTKALCSLLRRELTPQRLTRIAFQQLLVDHFRWRLRSFNVKAGKLVPILIPVHANTQQTFAVHGGGVPPGVLELGAEDYSRLRNGASQEQMLLEYALRIENPRINLPGTTDCLSCHAAGGIKGAASASLGLTEIPTVAGALGLVGKYNLQNVTQNLKDATHFRIFGYVTRAPSIGDRVILESALVAESLNLISL